MKNSRNLVSRLHCYEELNLENVKDSINTNLFTI